MSEAKTEDCYSSSAEEEAKLMRKCARKEIDITGMAYYEKIEAIAPYINGTDDDWYIANGQPTVIWNGEVRIITAEDAQYLLSKHVVVIWVDSKGDVNIKDPVDAKWIKNMLTWHNAPRINKITSIPYFNSEWELVSTDGYDSVSKTYFIDKGITIEEVDLETAKKTLRQLTNGMLFKSEADYANYIGFLLTPMVQTALNIKMVPFHVFRKNQRGTGATTAVNVLGYLYYEEPVQSYGMNEDTSDSEIRKTITSSLRMGLGALNFDDFTGTLDRMPIVQYMTSGTWTDRKLQESTMLSFPNPSMLMIGTGNNVFIGGDMARRCSLVEFYTELEHPELRPTDPPNLPAYIKQNRGLLLGALAALIKNWSEVPGNDKIGDFKEWSVTIDGILRDADISGFQTNRDQIGVLDVHADEMRSWFKGVYEWQERRTGPEGTLNEIKFTARELMDALKKDSDLKSLIPANIVKKMEEALKAENINVISRLLRTMVAQTRGGYRLECDSSESTKKFYVKKTSEDPV